MKSSTWKIQPVLMYQHQIHKMHWTIIRLKKTIRPGIKSESEDSYWKRKRLKFSLFLCERIVSRDTILLKFINSKTLLVLSKQSLWHLKLFSKMFKRWSRDNLAKQLDLYQCYDNVRRCPNISRTKIVSTNNFSRIWCFGLLTDLYVFYRFFFVVASVIFTFDKIHR